LPFIINSEIHGRIRLDDNIVEYSLFRNIDLFVRDVIVEVGYTIYDSEKIRFMENVEDIDLDIVDRKEDGWKFIGFGYKGGH
jgi:hypothetical protein